jgi:hypothetical protein
LDGGYLEQLVKLLDTYRYNEIRLVDYHPIENPTWVGFTGDSTTHKVSGNKIFVNILVNLLHDKVSIDISDERNQVSKLHKRLHLQSISKADALTLLKPFMKHSLSEERKLELDLVNNGLIEVTYH